MISALLISVGIGAGVTFLQSNVLSGLMVGGVRPDLVLILMVYFANANGSIPGQITGAAAGIIKDLITLSPLGFHTLIYTTIGLIYGGTKDKVFMDPILVPMLMTIVATILKGLLGALLSAVFDFENVISSIFSTAFLIEIGMNAILTPIFFALFRIIRPLKIRVPGSAT